MKRVRISFFCVRKSNKIEQNFGIAKYVGGGGIMYIE